MCKKTAVTYLIYISLPVFFVSYFLLPLELFAGIPQPVRAQLGLAVYDPRALFCLCIFLLSYFLVITEEQTNLPKSMPVLMGAGIIWLMIGIVSPEYNVSHDELEKAVFHDLEEYSSLMLFLFAAMTYISSLERGNVFLVLNSWLVRKGFTYKQLFMVTGIVAFFLSPIADNMTTALVMGAVVMALGAGNQLFITMAMVNIVCAANAGGAFSPFGDITTLMVWQSGRVEFFDFFALFLPAVATYLVPALIMLIFVPAGSPGQASHTVCLKRGAKRTIFLFILTIIMAVSFEQILDLPPFMGMMTGLSFLMLLAYYLQKSRSDNDPAYDIFTTIKNVDWDTLLFFFGVMFSVGGLAFIGYLELASTVMYGQLGPTVANVLLGAVSAIIDNIPIMFSVLTMGPEMDHYQWLLITLTCGVGGSILAIGSAAGVALLGVGKGHYTFISHLKWTPLIMVGYFAGIAVHYLING